MNKKDQLLKQAQELIKKAKGIEIQEMQKVGKLVLLMYAKNEIKDVELMKAVATIVGEAESSAQAKFGNTDNTNI